jgi:tRNA(Ile)-lysidine synthase
MSLLTKVRATLNAHQLVHRGDTLVVGVSGGPDSLALLHALRILAPELQLTLHVAHLNHRLRNGESDADEQFVLWLAREWALPVASASWDVREYADETGMSIEPAARELRYRFLLGVANQVQANAIAVAHNADDQVETILLHFLRGAGMTGLRGMAYKTQLLTNDERRTTNDALPVTDRNDPSVGMDLIRPLLDVTRREIDEYCADNNLQPREDESNYDTAYLRNRLRHNVIPYLETINPNFREVVRHSALSISDDYAYIQQNVLGIFDRMTTAQDRAFVFDRKWFRALPVNLQRGVLREAIARLRQLKNISYRHVENARRVAADKEAGAQVTLPQGLVLVVGYDDFTIGEHLPVPDAPLLLHGQELVLPVGAEVWLDDSDWGVRVRVTSDPLPASGSRARPPADRWTAAFDADTLRGQLILRPRRAGERFAPLGMGGKRKSLHEYMIDQKIPRHVRDFIPILADDETILWVVGYRVSEAARPEPGASSNQLEVEFFKMMD